jgi:transposase
VADRRDDEIAELQRTVAEQQEIIARLLARVDALEARLAQNSSNSGKPPSSDAPGDRPERPKSTPSGKPRGGQPGHKGHKRELLPPEQVTATVEHFPPACGACGDDLPQRPCAEPLRHQVIDAPQVAPNVTEHRLHAAECIGCGHVTRAALPEGVPRGVCGPRLIALIGLLTGAYHLSRRQASALLADLLGIRIALGTLSESEERLGDALAAPVQEALEHACREPVKHVDATGWREAGKARSLWTIATALVTVFAITLDGSKEHLLGVLTAIRGILVSDRAPQFGFWAMHLRQICWAHLLRKFVAFSEDKRPEVAKLGEQLLLFGHVLFHQWHRVRDGTLSRAAFRRDTMALRTCVENLLQRGADLRLRGVTGSCVNILEHREALWTFIDKGGVEPTNNHGERELRAFVIWRKTSFGSQSERGTRFAERVMTAVHSLRKQKRHVLSFLTAAVDATLRHRPAPSLLPPAP